jgi:hypothetical protein
MKRSKIEFKREEPMPSMSKHLLRDGGRTRKRRRKREEERRQMMPFPPFY